MAVVFNAGHGSEHWLDAVRGIRTGFKEICTEFEHCWQAMATNQYTESEQAKKQTPTIGSDMHTATNAAHEAYRGHLRYFA